MSHPHPPLADITNRIRQEENIARNHATTLPPQNTTQQHIIITRPTDTPLNETLNGSTFTGELPHQEEF